MICTNLVTGGAGFIGSHLVDKLLKDNQKVFCLDNLSSGSLRNLESIMENKDFYFIKKDVVENLDLTVDRIWHFGSLASELYYSKEPVETLKSLFLGSYNLLKLAKKNNARILLASSSEIYGEYSHDLQNESFYGNVNSFSRRACYSEGKRVSETLFYNFYEKYGVDIRIARIFNTYGPKLNYDDGRVISSFISNLASGKPVNIYGDGSQVRSFCYISDLLEGLILLMNSNFYDPINLGNNKEISIYNLANIISEKLQMKLKINFLKPKKFEPYKRVPSINLAKEILSWSPKINLDEGLDKTINYFLDIQRK